MTNVLFEAIEIVPELNIEGLKKLKEIRDNYSESGIGNSKTAELAGYVRGSLLKLTPEERKELIGDLEGQVLIDLGCHNPLYGYDIARILRARAYVGIEKYHGGFSVAMLKGRDELVKDDSVLEQFNGSNALVRLSSFPEIPATIIGEDMLTALKRFPSDYASLLACHIDGCILGDWPEYVREVEREISRVIHPKGVFLSYKSIVDSEDLHHRRVEIGHREIDRFTK